MDVYCTDEFDKLAQKYLSPEQYRELPKTYKKLKGGKIRGKMLEPFWLWETKWKDKRLYFVVVEDAALFVKLSHKDEQRETIEELRARKELLRQEVKHFKQHV